MNAYIFSGLPMVLQQYLIAPKLKENIYAEWDKVGGYKNWRDICLLENIKHSKPDWKYYYDLKNRRIKYEDTLYSAKEDIFILKNLSNGFSFISKQLNRTIPQVRQRALRFRGSLYNLVHPKTIK